MKNLTYSFLFCLTSLTSLGQVSDDFSDGDFAANPAWVGDISEFEIEAGQLNSMGPEATAVLHLATANSLVDNISWEFLIDMQFAPSGSNKVRVYLVSDESDLEGALNGYFIEIGKSGDDEIRLYRQDGSTTDLLFTGLSQLSGNVLISIRVERDDLGNWSVSSDSSGGTNWVSEGGIFQDNTYNMTSYFGFVAFHTTTRRDLFYFDNVLISSLPVGPAIDTVFIESSTQIRVVFNENVEVSSSENTANYAINNGVVIGDAQRNLSNHNEVILTTTEIVSGEYQLTIMNVLDEDTGTSPAVPLIANLEYLQLVVSGIETSNETEIRVGYNQPIDATSALLTSNYAIDQGIGEPLEINIEGDSVAVLTLTNSLQQLTTYSVTIQNVQNSVQNSELVETLDFDYAVPLQVENVSVRSEFEIELEFNLALDEASAETTSNYQIPGIGSPAIVDLVEDTLVVLTLGQSLFEGDFTLEISGVEDAANHPIAANYELEFSYLPLAVDSVKVISTESLTVYFNQPVEDASAIVSENYFLGGEIGNPASSSVDVSDPSIVHLTLENTLVNNDYQLSVNGVRNALLNSTADELIVPFTSAQPTSYRQIVINEIFFDPSPSQGLPEAEFLELYNRSEKTINLEEFVISGGTLGAISIAPQGFVILTNSANVDAYSSFGPTISVTNWNALNNTGESLTLYDNLGNLVDSITYHPSWYNDTGKEDGGYSLEQINPEIACNYSGNWTASNHELGGTPGTNNSIFDDSPDQSAPRLLGLSVIDSVTLSIMFSEPMDEASVMTATYSLLPSLTIGEVELVAPGLDRASVHPEQELVSGTHYELTISGAGDCAGNTMESESWSFYYDVLPPELVYVNTLSEHELELVFDEPVGSGSLGEENFTLNGIGAAIDLESDGHVVLVEFESPFQENQSYSLNISSLADTLGNSLAETVQYDFSYEYGVDTVLVMSPSHIRLVYQRPVDELSALRSTNYVVNNGVGSPVHSFMTDNSDSLVNLIFQNEFPENKMLSITARDIFDLQGKRMSTPARSFVLDTAPPKLDSLIVTSSQSIELHYNEAVSRASAEARENYEYNDIYPESAQLVSSNQVRLSFEDIFEEEKEYELAISSQVDLWGNRLNSRIKEAFVYDQTPPKLDSAWVAGPTETVLLVHEPLDTASAKIVTNYDLESVGQPTSVHVNPEFPKQATLEFSSPIPEQELEITAIGLMDTRGNVIEEAASKVVDYSTLRLGHVWASSPNILSVSFNKELGDGVAENSFQYWIGESLADNIQFEGRHGTLTFDISFDQDSIYQLSVESTGNHTLAITSYPFQFAPKFKHALITNSETIELHFNQHLNQNEVLNVSQFSVTPSVGSPQSAIISQENPTTVRLIFNGSLEPNVVYSVSWSGLTNEFGNLLPDYSTELIWDQQSPSVDSVEVLNDHTVWIQFSEILEAESAEFLGYYELVGVGQPVSVGYSESDLSVLVEFSQPFTKGASYQLILRNLRDMSGNVQDSLIVTFEYQAPYAPQYLDLIITEIMADPLEDQSEFFEVYNASQEYIELKGLTFKDGTSETMILGGAIEPGQYLVFAKDEELVSAENFGRLSSWLSLNNAGETLSLLNGENLIFSTSYSDAWYKSSDKEEGGHSLEMIDVTNPCGELRNWTGSVEIGGTPGSPNSVQSSNPDNFGPKLLSAYLQDKSALQLTFDEKLRPASSWEEKLNFSPELIMESAVSNDPNNDLITANFSEALESKIEYTIEIVDVHDCVGNNISNQNNPATFVLPESANSLDIIINEILFNPRSGGVDFVEIYNHSDKTIDLNGWYLGDKLTELKTLSLDPLHISPGEYLVLTPDSEILSADYPLGNAEVYFEMNGFPSFNDDEDSVLLLDSDKRIIDYTWYSDDYHFELLDDDEGVSLERIGFDVPSDDPESWQSAASTVGFATPGLPNSQTKGETVSEGAISIEPKVFFPDNTGFSDYTTISYELGWVGSIANVRIFTSAGQPVKTLASNELLSSRGFFTWDGTTDSGSRASIGYFVVWFEIFEPGGSKRVYKETVVLGTRF